MELESRVIDELVDSDFKPGIHEAYAYIMDKHVESMPVGRIRDYLISQLNNVNWQRIENYLKAVK